MRKGKKKDRAKKKHDTYPVEAKLVCDMLGGNTSPLISITFVGSPNLLTGSIHYPRSMGFMIERFDNGLRLVQFFWMPDYRNVIAFKNPKPTILTCVGSPIEDPEAENDVAFFLVRDSSNAPTKPFSLHADNLNIVDGQILYNAQNRCEPLRGYYEVFVASQSIHNKKWIVFCKFSVKETHSVALDDHERQNQLQQEGWIGHHLLQMVSRPGFSGSPIWDNQLRLYGMDIRGSTPQDSFYAERGDVAVCLPTNVLYMARQRIEATLQQRLSKA